MTAPPRCCAALSATSVRRFFPRQIFRGIVMAEQVLDEAVLEQAVEHRIGGGRRASRRRTDPIGILADDPPHHPLQARVDRGGSCCKGVFDFTGITGGFNVYSADVGQAVM